MFVFGGLHIRGAIRVPATCSTQLIWLGDNTMGGMTRCVFLVFPLHDMCPFNSSLLKSCAGLDCSILWFVWFTCSDGSMVVRPSNQKLKSTVLLLLVSIK